jgi:hypothetical protein
MKMPEKNHALGVKVSNLPQPLLPYRPRINRMSGQELQLNDNPENVQLNSYNQPASRELILQLIEALKEL